MSIHAVKTEVVAIRAMLAEVVGRLDLLERLIATDEGQAHTPAEKDDKEWMKGLDGLTRFNLERGWVTKDEVRKALRGQ